MLTNSTSLKVQSSYCYEKSLSRGNSYKQATEHRSSNKIVIVLHNSNNVSEIKPNIRNFSSAGTSHKIDSDYISSFIKLIASYETLEENWDGYGAKRPSSETIKDAISLINKFPRDTPPSRVGISGDGEISIIWDKDNLFADFGVVGDNKYCFFIQKGNEKLYGDDLSINEDVSVEVLLALRK